MARIRSSHALALAVVASSALASAPALAQQVSGDRCRVAFGEDALVAAGEVVEDVTVFGGDALIAGRVEGDVYTFGGNIELAPTAEVLGEVATVGGAIDAAPGARWDSSQVARGVDVRLPRVIVPIAASEPARPPSRAGLGPFVEEVVRQALAHALLFLLALLLMGLAPERLGAMQVAIVRDPARTGLFGLAGYVASALLIIALAITLIGIPAAVVLALLLPLATYVGLAAAATVIGAALPIERLRARPVRQLAGGVLLLFVASIVPYVGTLTVAAAACLGLGALIRTRFRTSPPPELLDVGAPLGEGPYRTASVS